MSEQPDHAASNVDEIAGNSDQPIWAIAIFSHRENLPTLYGTILAASRASAKPVIVDLIINGNPSLAEALCDDLPRSEIFQGLTVPLRIWSINLGDKAHAWNQYLDMIWPEAETTFFIDGNVRLNQDALEQLHEALSVNTNPLAATGVPSTGRTAAKLRQQMLDSGGIHGNLYALRKNTMRQLRSIGFHLPIGLYRTDSLLGAALRFSLDPTLHTWNPKYIFVHPKVTWDMDEKKWWRWSDVQGQIKRILRQAQGDLENAAVRDHMALHKMPVAALPATVTELIAKWIARSPEQAEKLLNGHPLRQRAMRRLQQPPDWSSAKFPPRLVAHFGTSQTDSY